MSPRPLVPLSPCPLGLSLAGENNERRGIVLIAVLIVIVLLSLAAYQFTDMTMEEYQLTSKLQRAAQAKALADSGVHYAAAMLSSYNAYNQTLQGNPFNNQTAFDGSQLQVGSFQNVNGWFRIVAPYNPEDIPNQQPPYQFGVTDESGKINLNALMQLDTTGDTCYNVLLQLPVTGMNTDVAESIVDWMAPQNTRPNQGSEASYYAGLPVPVQVKYGPIDTMDEMLLIHNVTPAVFYGDNVNRSGIPSSSQPGSSGQFNPGLAAYVTVYSTEPNVDSTGQPRINVNQQLNSQTDVTNLLNALTQALSMTGGNGQGLANYIVACRLHGGPVAMTSASISGGAGGALTLRMNTGGQTDIPANQLTFTQGAATTNISSLYQLLSTRVTITTSPTPANPRPPAPVSYVSPLNDATTATTLAPVMFNKLTTTANAYIPARVNINTAPLGVLQAIPYMWQTNNTNGTTWISSSGSSGQTSGSSGGTGNAGANTQGGGAGAAASNTNSLTQYGSWPQQIYTARQTIFQQQQPPAIYQTPAWLMTQQQATLTPPVTASALQKLEPYITATTNVYRVQSIGEYDSGGPFARVEAVIQVYAQRPQFLFYRELTDLGKGIDD